MNTNERGIAAALGRGLCCLVRFPHHLQFTTKLRTYIGRSQRVRKTRAGSRSTIIMALMIAESAKNKRGWEFR